MPYERHILARVSVYRVPQMQGFGHADVLVVLQVPGNSNSKSLVHF
jgi:hypothetical protein